MGKVDRKLVFSLVFVILFVFEGVAGRSIDEQDNSEEEIEIQDETEVESHRSSRLFPLFPWNKPKSSSSNAACGSGDMAGTCQSSKYCKLKGGINTMPMTNCEGKNVCCQIRASCAAEAESCPIRESGVMIIHENVTTQYQRHYVFPRIKGACQLKLELVLFELRSPKPNGNCETDSMTISGSPTVNRFRICGENTGQVLYLDYGTSDMIKLTMNIKNTEQPKTRFLIRPTFIRCDSSNRVPAHCLQYFKEPSFQVQSFNFAGNLHLANLDYTVCIKSPDDNTEITWKECVDVNANNFFVSGNQNYPVNSLTGVENCPNDYVEIFGGGRHCGTSFPSLVKSSARPFLLNVRFDAGEELTPPPPTGLDPKNCNSPDPNYDCEKKMEGGVETCQCVIKPGSMLAETSEIGNSGFCLEYSKL